MQKIVEDAPTPIIEREVILAMAKREANYWVSDAANRWQEYSSPWSKRALLVASYSLGDEGKHWRDGVKKTLLDPDAAFLEWVSSKNNGRMWELPL